MTQKLPFTKIGLAGLILGAFCRFAAPATAQGNPLMGQDMAVMAQLWGQNQFSATAVLTLTYTEPTTNEVHEQSVIYANGNLRMEDDLSRRYAGKPKVVEALKQDRLTRIVYVMRADKHMGYLIVPGRKEYLAMETASGDPEWPRSPTFTRKELGKETIDGHPCVKVELTITTEERGPENCLVWEATDLGRLTIRFQSEGQPGTKELLVLKNVKLGKIDPALFAPPVDYKKLSEPEAAEFSMVLMQLEMGEMDAPGPPPPPAPAPAKPDGH